MKAQIPQRPAWISVLGISLIFLLPGSIAIADLPRWLEGESLRRDNEHFVQTECVDVVASVKRITLCSGHGGCYRPVVTCSYEVGGQRYEVDSRYSGFGRGSKSESRSFASARSSRTFHAYYDPRRPSRALLSRSVDSAGFAITGILGVALTGFVALLWVGAAAVVLRAKLRMQANPPHPN